MAAGNNYPNSGQFDAARLQQIGIQVAAMQNIIDKVEEVASDYIDVYLDQRNLFSALVGAFAIRAIADHTVFDRNPHRYRAQQYFPDLTPHGQDPANLRPTSYLEVKASKRTWSLDAHGNHEGWYMVFRYMVMANGCHVAGHTRSVFVGRVDLMYLNQANWCYQPSLAGPGVAGRTHTFSLLQPSNTLNGNHVFLRSGIKMASDSAAVVGVID